MNYANADSTARLASGWWRIRHSAWLLAPILGLGMFSFVGFVYVGLRVRSRKFWIACMIGCLGSAMVWISEAVAVHPPGEAGWDTDVLMVVWMALIVYAFVLNRDYLRWRASRTPAQAWYNQPATVQTNMPPAPRPENRFTTQPVPPTRGEGILGVSGAAEYYSAPNQPKSTILGARSGETPPVRMLDANFASVTDLVTLLGVDKLLAERVVSARARQGSFLNLDDMARAAALQPHEFVRFRGLVTFGESRPNQGPPITGLPGIRRLDY